MLLPQIGVATPIGFAYGRCVRTSFIAATIVAGVLLAGMPAGAAEQTITPLTPSNEQRVEMLGGGEQGVRAVETQQVATVVPQEPPSAAAKVASTVGKAVLAVVGAAVALGAMAASLLLV